MRAPVKMKNSVNTKILSISIFIVFILVGLASYQDYGISLDERHHREHALFWYTHSKDLINDFFSSLFSSTKYFTLSNETNLATTSLYDKMGGEVSFVGSPLSIFFEFLIDLFNIKNSKDIFEFRHLFNFLVFFTGLLIFYKLIHNRYKSYLFSIIGVLFLFLSPRFFAESFYNQKDIFFLTLTIAVMYTGLNFLEKSNLINTLLFSISTALAFNTRIMVFIPLVIILLIFLIKSLNSNSSFKKNLKFIIYYFIFTSLLIVLFWPYLWLAPIENFIFIFKKLLNAEWFISNFYLGKFILATNIPWHYHTVWIGVTSPMIIILFFLIGSFFVLQRLHFRFIKSNSNMNKIWRSKEEMYDIFFFALVFLSIGVFIKKSLGYSGWRHLYFIYPSIIMISLYGVYRLRIIFKKKSLRSIIYFLILINLSYLTYWNYKFHPFQYVYFNPFFKNDFNEKFEMDYWGVSNKSSIEYIINNNSNYPIKIGTKSKASLEISSLILSDSNKAKILIVHDLKDADFIITNYITRLKNNFKIDKSKFEKYYEILVDDKPINTVYKKLNN